MRVLMLKCLWTLAFCSLSFQSLARDYENFLSEIEKKLRYTPGFLEKSYDEQHPYYLKYCATTKYHPRKGKHGTVAGHTVFYLKGVCSDKSIGPSGLKLCPEDADYSEPDLGTGLSVDKGLKNVNFFTFPTRKLFLSADLQEGETFTPEIKQKIVRGVLEENVFAGVEQHKYPQSVQAGGEYEHLANARFGTDYGLSMARNLYCLNIPFPRGVMGELVDFLNELNASYENSVGDDFRGVLKCGVKHDSNFHWSAFWDNCTHTPINALASVGVIEAKKVNAPLIQQVSHLAVPSNTLLDLHDAIHHEDIDVEEYYANPIRRRIFLEHRWIPQSEGAFAEFIPMYKNNAVYKEDDHILFIPSFVRNISKRMRKLARTPRYSYFGQGEKGFAPNLYYFLLKYEKALDRIAEKKKTSYFQKKVLAADAKQMLAVKEEMDELSLQYSIHFAQRNKNIEKHLVNMRKDLQRREEAAEYLEFYKRFETFLREKKSSIENRISNMRSEGYEH